VLRGALRACRRRDAQTGIFALGTPEHCYLEVDLLPGRDGADLVATLAGVSGPPSSTGDVTVVTVVTGFRPEPWARPAPGDAPTDAAGWAEDLIGVDGFRMPATRHDAWVWVSGGTRTAVFDNSRAVLAALAPLARVATEVTGWVYRSDRDLTGFVDGTENPTLLTAPAVAVVPDGQPGAGSSVVLFQRWQHDTDAWESLDVRSQELAMVRTKADSVELADDEMPASAHVVRFAPPD